MSQTISTLAVDVIAKTGGLTDGLELTKRELREAAKVAEQATDSTTRLANEREKLMRFAKAGALDEKQLAEAMRQAAERFKSPEQAAAEEARLAAIKAREHAELSMLARIKSAREADARDAARIAESQLDYMQKLERETAKIRRLGAAGHLTTDQVRGGIRDAERRFIPTADLVEQAKKPVLADFLQKGFHPSQIAKVRDLTKDVTDMNKAFGVLPFSIDPATTAMRGMAVGSAALAGAVAAIGVTVVSRIKEIDNLGDAAARLGMSASALSEIRGAGFLGDIEAATVDTMIQKMLVAVGKEKEVFAELGLDVERLRQQSPAAMFEEIAGAINAIPDEAGQMAAIAEVFGRGGPEGAALVARFQELSQAIRESGAVVSDDLAAGIGATDDAMKRLSLSAEAFANTLAGISAGPLTEVLDAATSLAQSGAFEQGAGTIVGFLTGNSALGGQVSRSLLDEANANRNAAEQDRLKDSNDAIDAALEHELEGHKVTAEQIARVRRDNLRNLIEEDARFERELQQARVRDAIRAIDEEERARKKAAADAWDDRMKEVEDGQKLIDSLKTPAEATKDRLLSDLDALRKSGLDSPETRDRLFRRAAGELARQEQGGFGAPGADKGTRAAREAIIGAQHQAEQTDLLRRIEDRLRALVEKDEIEITEITAS